MRSFVLCDKWLPQQRGPRTFQLGSPNRYSVLATEIKADASRKEEMEVRKNERKPLREVTIKIRLERLDTQEGITVEALLDSGATGLVMSSEFARKKERF